MRFLRYNSNVCDHISDEIIVMVTKACPNKCAFCIDQLNPGITSPPNFDAIRECIMKYHDKITNIVLSGGEPLLYLKEVYDLVKYLKENTKCKVTINTSIPIQCYNNKELFFDLVRLCDCILLSGQHYNQKIADQIRKSKSKFDRIEFYKTLENKDKFIISLNIHKPFLYKKYDILKNIENFNSIGFNNIKICELYEHPESYVSIDEALGIKLPQPFAVQCSTKNYDISNLLPNFKGNLTIKKCCFIKSNNLKANFWDLFKTATRRIFMRKKYFFGVIQPNGEIYPYWI